MPVRKLTSEQRLSRAIDIMEALYAAGENGIADTVLDDADLAEKVNGVAALGSDCDGISGAELKVTVRDDDLAATDDGTHQHVAVQGLVQIEQF